MEEVMSKKERISRYVVLCLLSVFILTPFVLGLDEFLADGRHFVRQLVQHSYFA